MKWVISFISTIGIILIFICGPTNVNETKYLRIHIRANSDSQADQMVKYIVKDAVVDFLIPLLSEVNSFEDAKNCVEQNYSEIESVANGVLQNYGFNYKSSALINTEHFPTRQYDEIVLQEGDYESLIINLGSGQGNNWWCLVYPAFCFTSSTNSDNVVYISKILEIIKNITKGD
ncbi:MAG: hypothetical protein E7379_03350 [Clostridiales bacterium]|nr:hypothetical protein [Clostridiales bacterium]